MYSSDMKDLQVPLPLKAMVQLGVPHVKLLPLGMCLKHQTHKQGNVIFFIKKRKERK
jgi:hypothetical protein